MSAAKLSLKPNTTPITNDNLTSPPPKDSLLKIILPIFKTANIKANIIKPLNKDKSIVLIPKKYHFNNNIKTMNKNYQVELSSLF